MAIWKPYFDAMDFRISPLPPPVDYALMIDAIDIHHLRPEVEHFCLVTADRDFAPLAAKLRERGLRVTGIAQGPVATALRNACDEFISLDRLSKAALSRSAVPEVIATMREVYEPNDWADHNWLSSRLKERGFNPRAYGKSSLIDIIDALPDHFETRPTPRSAGPVVVRSKA